MFDRNQPIRTSVIAILAVTLVTLTLPVQAAPTSTEAPVASLWSLVDDAWQSLVGAFSGSGGNDDGEGGPILDPDGQPLAAPNPSPDSEGSPDDPATTGARGK